MEKPNAPMLTYIVAIYAASLLMANVLANHMLVIGTWVTSAGILTFPITYILASTLAEVYGYKWARRAAWLSFALNALMAIFIFIAIRLPQPYWYDGTIFSDAMGGVWRIVVASLTAFALGKFINDQVFVRIRKKQGDTSKGFAFRALASSLGGHIVDTAIFSVVAFAGVIPREAVLTMIGTGVILKWGYEWLAIPLTIRFTNFVRRGQLKYETQHDEKGTC